MQTLNKRKTEVETRANYTWLSLSQAKHMNNRLRWLHFGTYQYYPLDEHDLLCE